MLRLSLYSHTSYRERDDWLVTIVLVLRCADRRQILVDTPAFDDLKIGQVEAIS